MSLTAAAIAQATGAPLGPCSQAWPLLLAALGEQRCASRLTQIGAAATVTVECAGWSPVAERRAAPGTRVWALQERYWASGYYGRGLIQLTGRRNYEAAGEALGLDLLGCPDLALDLEVSCRVFAWFFRTSRAAAACEAQNWRLVRQRVNGPGLIHLDTFEGHVARLLEVACGC